MAQHTYNTSNQRVASEGREGTLSLFMSPSFPSLTLEDPSKAAQKAPYEVKDLCMENHKTLLKERRDNSNDTPYS